MVAKRDGQGSFGGGFGDAGCPCGGSLHAGMIAGCQFVHREFLRTCVAEMLPGAACRSWKARSSANRRSSG